MKMLLLAVGIVAPLGWFVVDAGLRLGHAYAHLLGGIAR